ncbi:MAG: hypothetical protein ACKVJX_15350 [Verrucomicrobiia bacterium]
MQVRTVGPESSGEPAKSKKPLYTAMGVAAVLGIVGLAVLLAPKSDEEDVSGALPLPGGGEQSAEPVMDEPVGTVEQEAPTRAPLNPDDLAFMQRKSEALWVIRVGDALRSPVGQAALGNLGPGPRTAVNRLRDGVGIDLEEIDYVAVAFSKLTLSARFAYVEQKAYLERRIGVTRSSTARKRLARSLEKLRPPPPSAMLAKVRFKEVVDLEKLMANVEEKETGDNGGKTLFRFKLPSELRAAYPVKLAAFQIDATDILVGQESLVIEAMNSRSEVSLAELGLNQIDLERDVLIAFAPSSDGKRQLKAIIGHQLRDESRPWWLHPSMLSGMDKMTSGLVAFDLNGSLEIKASVTGATEDQARDIAGAINDGLPAMITKFDIGVAHLQAGLRRPLSEAAGSLNARQDGLRVEGSLSLPREMFGHGLDNALKEMDLASLFMRGSAATPNAAEAPAEGPSSTIETPAMAASTRVETAAARSNSGASAPRPAPANSRAVRPTAPNRTLRGWTMNVLHAAIADKPLIGRIAGNSFESDETLLENGVLILRMGSKESPNLIVEIHNLQRPGESIDGKTYELPHVSGVNTPTVFFRWRDPKKLGMNVQRFYNGFAIKLEFDRIRGGRITGKVFVALPDGKKSYINGTFDAEAR